MLNDKKNICIILPGKLPIPNIKGGAIETLMTLLINQNEIYNKVHFIVISAWTEGIEKATSKYKNTEFHYVKLRKGFWKRFINFMNYMITKITGNIDFFKTPFHHDIQSVMEHINADAVVVEHGVYKHFEFLRKNYDREQLYLHLHGSGPMPDKKTKKTFGHVITVSEFLKNVYIEAFKSYGTKFHVCYNGINDTCFQKRILERERKDIRTKFGVEDNDFLLIYCGRLIYEKGVKELVRAVIDTRNSHIKLMIVGSSNFQDGKQTDYVKNLQDMITEYHKQIFFTGYLANDELYQYYQSADLQVICSICEEAGGLVAIEGQMCNLPLIITDSGGLLEYITTKDYELVNKNNSIVNLTDRTNLSKQITKLLLKGYKSRVYSTDLGKPGLCDMKHYSSKSFYDRFVELFL